MLRELSVLAIVSVQKCHNTPICGLFAKPANFIFKFLSLKISLIQADCHWKQVLIVRSTRFHGFEQSLEILPERDSDLLASLDKGIVHCRSQCTLNITKEQRALSIYQTPHIGLTMTEMSLESLPCLIYVYVGTRSQGSVLQCLVKPTLLDKQSIRRLDGNEYATLRLLCFWLGCWLR